MKFLKEAYGQSEDLDIFVAQAKGRFRKYYIVSFDIKDTGKHQEEYFAFEDAAREYYNNLIEDIKEEYDWDVVDVYLYKVDISAGQEELENELIMKEDEEE